MIGIQLYSGFTEDYTVSQTSDENMDNHQIRDIVLFKNHSEQATMMYLYQTTQNLRI